jgi:hypothetical protein
MVGARPGSTRMGASAHGQGSASATGNAPLRKAAGRGRGQRSGRCGCSTVCPDGLGLVVVAVQDVRRLRHCVAPSACLFDTWGSMSSHGHRRWSSLRKGPV